MEEPRPPLFVLRGIALCIDVFVAARLIDAAFHIRNAVGIKAVLLVPEESLLIIDQAVAFAALIAVFLGQTWCGYTIGKLVTFSRVVDAKTNGPISLYQAMARTLLLPIDFLPFAGVVGFTASRRTPMAQRYGDDLAGTRVIRVGRPEVKHAAAALFGPAVALGLLLVSYVIAS